MKLLHHYSTLHCAFVEHLFRHERKVSGPDSGAKNRATKVGEVKMGVGAARGLLVLKRAFMSTW